MTNTRIPKNAGANYLYLNLVVEQKKSYFCGDFL